MAGGLASSCSPQGGCGGAKRRCQSEASGGKVTRSDGPSRKGAVRWKAFRAVEAVVLHGPTGEIVLAVRESGRPRKRRLRKRAATETSEARSRCAQRVESCPCSTQPGPPKRVWRRETLRSPSRPGASPEQTEWKPTRRGCSYRVVGWQRSVRRTLSYDHAGRREANRVGWH